MKSLCGRYSYVVALQAGVIRSSLPRNLGMLCAYKASELCSHTSNTSNHAAVDVEVLPMADTVFFQHVAALVCHHEGANSSVCWEENTRPALCAGLNW